MKEKVINWLLEEENPTVRYLTLTDLMGLSKEDREVAAAKESIMNIGVVPALLDLQK
ncbi:MAG TPA: hypothetical protein PKN37_04290 [Mesotoga sp.]|nr:hypothetical protein [Mesotoga sp.]HNU23460.1 hypothetical protein [Mesotoga sp.]